MDYTNFADGFAGGVTSTGAIAAIIALGILGALLLLALYVYNSLAWQTIGNRLKYKKSWLAWIPIANISMLLQLGGFHWAWVFLILVPVLGWIALFVLAIISIWRILVKRNYPGWLALLPVLGMVDSLSAIAGIAFLILIGFVAWGKK